jgi:hypothetical protein
MGRGRRPAGVKLKPKYVTGTEALLECIGIRGIGEAQRDAPLATAAAKAISRSSWKAAIGRNGSSTRCSRPFTSRGYFAFAM